MESFEVSEVSKFAEYVATYDGRYGHVGEKHGGFAFRHMKFLLTMFDLRKVEKLLIIDRGIFDSN